MVSREILKHWNFILHSNHKFYQNRRTFNFLHTSLSIFFSDLGRKPAKHPINPYLYTRLTSAPSASASVLNGMFFKWRCNSSFCFGQQYVQYLQYYAQRTHYITTWFEILKLRILLNHFTNFYYLHTSSDFELFFLTLEWWLGHF